MRQLIKAGAEIVDIGFTGTSDVPNSYGKAEKILFYLKEGRSSEDFTHIRDVLDEYMKEQIRLKNDPNPGLSHVPTGFEDMDRILSGGLQDSDLIVLAARPSLGKSTLAFNIAREASVSGKIVGIFSLEMSKSQIGMRMLANESGINATKIRTGLITESEEQSILNSIGLLSSLDIYIDDSPMLEVFQILAKARRLQAERGLDLIVIDYMQLLNISGRSDNRVQVMSEISRALKGLARDLDVPVLALSQLSRAVEQRQSHIPVLSDLRESGSIEQDADIVAFIYREDQYIKEEEWDSSPQNIGTPYPKNIAKIIIAKHRNGPVGEFPLYFREDLIKFESIVRPVQQGTME
jgi:replicative DNA helicase